MHGIPMMRLSVLIVNWNTRDDLERCLASLRLYCGGSQIVVVDNASTDGSVEMVRCKFPEVTVLALDRNLGYAEGNNLAAEASSGKWLLLLNPDTVVQPDTVETLIRFLEERPKAALAAPKLVSTDGSTQASVRGMPTPLALFAAWFHLDKLLGPRPSLTAYRLPAFDYESTQPAPQPMASAWLVRREAWEAVGPFDPAFPLFFNDVDWCLRAQEAGWETWYVSEAVVVHRGGASTAQVKPKATAESHRALAAFYHKHYLARLGGFRMALCVGAIRIVGAARTLWYTISGRHLDM
jgi:GT2 family glycosyltransferase